MNLIEVRIRAGDNHGISVWHDMAQRNSSVRATLYVEFDRRFKCDAAVFSRAKQRICHRNTYVVTLWWMRNYNQQLQGLLEKANSPCVFLAEINLLDYDS